jgi:putative ABC transport system permease protein
MEGRLTTDRDDLDAERVVVVNRRLAERYWPNESALGKRLKRGRQDSEEPWMTVVGVVGEPGATDLGEPPPPSIFVPHAQLPFSSMLLAARTVGDPMNTAAAARSVIHEIDPDLPITDVQTMRAAIDLWFVEQRASAWMLGSLALLSLALAGFGLYGVMSYAVARRTHEIGVRMAVGAGHREILRLVIRRCLVLSAIGLGVGLLITAPVNIMLGSFLPGVGYVDPVTLIGVIAVFLAVALLAGYLPARRATRIDPIAALRYE